MKCTVHSKVIEGETLVQALFQKSLDTVEDTNKNRMKSYAN